MKYLCVGGTAAHNVSHPARGAWIEMAMERCSVRTIRKSHPARGAWIEIYPDEVLTATMLWSHPARGAWIEMT